LLVEWKSPLKTQNVGKPYGFYVGFKKAKEDKPYSFETVEFLEREDQHSIEMEKLEVYTEYEFVVQAFYRQGSGPFSEKVRGFTAEGTPSLPPRIITVTSISSSTIYVAWSSPPLSSINGILRGYKVIYGPSKSWDNENTRTTVIVDDPSETKIENLQKYTNYSLQMLAFTNAGDGVESSVFSVTTNEDVPSAPESIKASAMSETSILVTWKPPAEPNGKIVDYTVYIKEVDNTKDSISHNYKVPDILLSYQKTGLKPQTTYELWVTASTNAGEGVPSVTSTVTLSSTIPAKVASFDENFLISTNHNVKLPCVTVGNTRPDVKWKVNGKYFVPSDKAFLLLDGSLQVMRVTKEDEGIYQCLASNKFGEDMVTHRLKLNGPPSPPVVILTSQASKSITFKIKTAKDELTPIAGFIVQYRLESGDWKTEDIGFNTDEYTLNRLKCGQQYQLYALAYNKFGNSTPSLTVHTKTNGGKPTVPDAKTFLEVSAGSITLHLDAWEDEGCPIKYFAVQYKAKDQTDWFPVSRKLRRVGNYTILDLDPAKWYNLKVTALNGAGFTNTEYEFATLTTSGGTITPDGVIERPSCTDSELPMLKYHGIVFLRKFKAFWFCQKDTGSKARRNILNTIKQMAFDAIELNGSNLVSMKMAVMNAEDIMNGAW